MHTSYRLDLSVLARCEPGNLGTWRSGGDSRSGRGWPGVLNGEHNWLGSEMDLGRTICLCAGTRGAQGFSLGAGCLEVHP